MITSTIADTRVRVRPSKKFLKLLDTHIEHVDELPANIASLLKSNGYSVPAKINIIKDVVELKRPKINKVLLKKLTASVSEEPPIKSEAEISGEEENPADKDQTHVADGGFLYLADLHWFNDFLAKLREFHVCNTYLYELLQNSELILPENEIKPRNPELEARCQRLREQQQNREYLKMTKNVDAGLKHYPDDTIAYQMKSINRQIIAIAQFIFSVAAGFAFGFLGVHLIVGNLPFGFRLLLGIIVALIVALAEMYFLAKKLHELDVAVDAPKHKSPASPSHKTAQTAKPHND